MNRALPAAAGFLLSTAAAFAPASAGQPTQLSLRPSSPNPSEAGQGIVVFADLQFEGATPPAGSLTIGDGVDSCTATLPQNYCVYLPGSSGSKSLTASYSGDANFDPSSAPAIAHEVAAYGYPRRVSVALAQPNFGTPAGTSAARSLSADMRLLAFSSYAGNFIAHDNAGKSDVFVLDRDTQRIDTLSLGLGGALADGDSLNPVISADGGHVAFESAATNLVAGDSNARGDVFAYDRSSGILSLVSIGSAGEPANNSSFAAAISADGRYVVFTSSASNLVAGTPNGNAIYRRDRVLGITQFIAPGERASISADGDTIAFDSVDASLVPGDTNARRDVFLYQVSTQAMTRASVSAAGAQANADSQRPRLTPDASHVVFESEASNLVSADTNGSKDIFVRDLQTGSVVRASVESSGLQFVRGGSYDAAISADGSRVAFTSSDGNLPPYANTIRTGAFWHDLISGVTERANVSSVAVVRPEGSGTGLSADGRYVLFNSTSWGFDRDDSNNLADPILRDTQLGLTEALVKLPYGTQSTGYSRNGYFTGTAEDGYAAFLSVGSNFASGDTFALSDIFVRKFDTGAIQRISVAADGGEPNGGSYDPAVTPDGRYAIFFSESTNIVPGAGSSTYNVYLRDLAAQSNELISANNSGDGGGSGHSQHPRLSDDARFVAFYSAASNLVVDDTNAVADIFVRDRLLGSTRRVSVSSTGAQANGASAQAIISADGRYVAFASAASNLVAGDSNGVSDVFVHDRQDGSTTLVSRTAAGLGNAASLLPEMSRDGRFVVFHSDASNLVANDTNAQRDVFLVDRSSASLRRVSVASSGAQGNGVSDYAAVSDDGRYVAFRSEASNLDDGDSNGVLDIFVHEVASGLTARASINRDGQQGDGLSDEPFISADGRHVMFYSGATNLVAGDSNGTYDVFLTVNPFLRLATQTLLLGFAPTTSVVGESYTVGVAVDSGGNAAAGNVVIDDGAGASCTATLSSGSGSCALVSRQAGSRTVTARYAGTSTLEPSSATATHTVNRAGTAASLSASALRIAYGDTLVLTGQLSTVAPGSCTPGGSVTFYDAASPIGQATLANAAATFGTTTLSLGTHALSLRYAGDANCTASTSPALQVVVLPRVALAMSLLGIDDFAGGGRPLQYTLHIRNNGPHAVLGARVTSALPANLGGAQWRCSAVAANCAASGSGDIDQPVDIQPFGSVDFVVSGQVQAIPELPLAIAAAIAAPDAVEDDLGDNSVDRTIAVGIFRDGFAPD